MKIHILVTLFSFLIFTTQSNAKVTESSKQNALTTAKNYIKFAKMAWELETSFAEESLDQTKKGAYCAMGEELIDLATMSKNIFGDVYKNTSDQEKHIIENALLDNIAHIFLDKIGDKINFVFDWEKAHVQETRIGRGRDRVKGLKVDVKTWHPKFDIPASTQPKKTSTLTFEIIPTETEGEYLLVDLVLKGIRVSSLYGEWVRQIRLEIKTLDEVLSIWEDQNDPNCPSDLEPYRNLF